MAKKKETVQQEVQQDESREKSLNDDFEPVAVEVTLRPQHPQDSYGRAGFRFNKETAVEIAVAELSDGKLQLLMDDPWLDVVCVTAK